MEISLNSQSSLKIKGKQGTLLIGLVDKTMSAEAFLLFQKNENYSSVIENALVIDGPGSYEVAGIKIISYKHENELIHSFSLDKIDILVGKIAAVEKMVQKVGEHQVVILLADTQTNASFATGIATNVLVFYGEMGKETAEKTAKGSVLEVSKYTVTSEKLPLEVETVLLASG